MGAHDFGDHTVFTKGDDEQPETPKINWRHNCLTGGIHDGRPEAIWNLPLLQASTMFETEGLKQLVVARIYKDAMQQAERTDVEHNLTPEWAQEVANVAEKDFVFTLARKMAEVQKYYTSSSYKRDFEHVIEWYKGDKLNPHYEPLHGHDTINMLCRILGQSSDFKSRPASS